MDGTTSGYVERPDYRVDLLARRNRVVARHHGRVLADTTTPLLVDEQDHGLVVYFPRTDVDVFRLRRTDSQSYCPFKGTASYWSLAGGGRDIAWSYDEPYPEVARLAGHVAFYQDRVEVVVGAASPRVAAR